MNSDQQLKLDFDHIHRMCELLEATWQLNPKLRLGQLIVDLASLASEGSPLSAVCWLKDSQFEAVMLGRGRRLPGDQAVRLP